MQRRQRQEVTRHDLKVGNNAAGERQSTSEAAAATRGDETKRGEGERHRRSRDRLQRRRGTVEARCRMDTEQ